VVEEAREADPRCFDQHLPILVPLPLRPRGQILFGVSTSSLLSVFDFLLPEDALPQPSDETKRLVAPTVVVVYRHSRRRASFRRKNPQRDVRLVPVVVEVGEKTSYRERNEATIDRDGMVDGDEGEDDGWT